MRALSEIIQANKEAEAKEKRDKFKDVVDFQDEGTCPDCGRFQCACNGSGNPEEDI